MIYFDNHIARWLISLKYSRLRLPQRLRETLKPRASTIKLSGVSMRNCTSVLLVLAIAVGACASDPASPSGGGTVQLTAPALDTPSDDEQLTTLRPTLVVRNGSSNPSGTRTYEYQLSTSSSFTTVALSRGGVAENASGRTSFVVDSDLQSTTRYYWRSRVSQGSSNSEWTAVGRFRTKAVGFNRPGELYDPLVAEETVGERFGSTTFVAGKGLTLNTATSYVRYALPATVSAGEFSMEIEGLRPNATVAGKPRLFSMLNGTGRLDLSKYQMNVQDPWIAGQPGQRHRVQGRLGRRRHEARTRPRGAAAVHPNPRSGSHVFLASHLDRPHLPGGRPRGRSRRERHLRSI